MKKLVQSLFVLLLIASAAIAQDKSITGKVTAKEDGLALPGVSVKVSGTNLGTQTDANGNYSISIPSNSKNLLFSYIGYSNQTVSIGTRTTVNVILESDSKQLGEVVVTALGFETRKDKLGTAQSTIKAELIEKSGEVSALNALSSKASGVLVSRSSGDPGAGTYVQIRGQSTISGNLQPLFVIDGIPVSNSTLGNATDGVVQQSRMGDINPSDIASVEVLKGAAAAALWGTRAANGVILITTKKGKINGKPNIEYTGSYSLDQLNREVPLQTNYGQGLNGRFTFGNSSSFGDKISDRTGGSDTFLTAGDYLLLADGTKRYRVASGTAANVHGGKNSTQVYNHASDLFRTGTYFDNNLSINGGDDKGTYYVSLANLDQDGTLKAGSDYHRKSFKINADRKFGILKVATNIGYSNSNSNRAQQGSNISGIYLGGLRTAPDFDNNVYEGTYVNANGELFPNRQVAYRNPIGANANSIYDNPFWIINRITSTSVVNRMLGSFEATVDIKPWLSLIDRVGVDYYSDDRTDNFPTISSANQGGKLTIEQVSETQVNNDLILRGNHSFSKDFSFTGLVGFNYNNRVFNNIGSDVRNFILPNAPFDLTNSQKTDRSPFNRNTLIRTAASYAQLDFDFYDQLSLSLTGRAENSSTFANTFFYPSASLAWQFTKLKSLENKDGLSFGKLRASYGEVGVQPNPYVTGTYFDPLVNGESYGSGLDASSPVYGGGYSRSFTQGNINIKPERKKEFEIGTDLRFFNNRLSLSGTYYSNKTIDAIFGVQVPSTTGYTNKQDNAAEIENKGVEFDLGYNWFTSKDFTISSNLVWSTNENKVVSLKGVESFFLAGYAGVSSRAVEGQPLGALWGIDFDRDADGKMTLDANGFPQAGPSESVIGDPNPDWMAGLNTSLNFKKFSFSFLIDHVQGGDVWNGTRGALVNFGKAAETGNEVTSPVALVAFNGATVPANTPFRGEIKDFGAGPVALDQSWYSGSGLGSGFGPVGSQFIEDGTRTRLREVSLGYTLSGNKFLQKAKLQSISFNLTGRNLALITDYKGIDPETNNTGTSNGRGLDYFNNPSTKSYLFTIRVKY
ncbi:MAG: SusC/RagA family TonB-linked outer membrane protein [Candidatus Dojkabacteria bacterium]